MAPPLCYLMVTLAALPFLVAGSRSLSTADACTSCVAQTTKVYSDMCAPEAQDKLADHLASSTCSDLPLVAQAECKSMLNAAVPTVCSKLTAAEAAGKICSSPELCAQATLGATNDDTCTTCKMVIMELANMLHDPTTQKDIIEYAKEACEIMKQMEDQCTMYVETYGPLVLNMAMQYLQPDLCSKLGYCPTTPPSDIAPAA